MDARLMFAPQADDIVKILDLPLAVAEGDNTKSLISRRYKFDERQVDYYLEACECLGLVDRAKSFYVLTEDGRKYIRLDPPRQKLAVIRKMLVLPIIAQVMAEIIANDRKAISREEIESMIELYCGIHGTTVPRRAQTLMTWFRWMGEETGVFSADSETIRLSISLAREW